MSIGGGSSFSSGSGPRFNSDMVSGHAAGTGLMPMGPSNQGSIANTGMLATPPMFQDPRRQFDGAYTQPSQSQLGPPPPLMGPPRETSPRPMQHVGGQNFMGPPPAMPAGLPQIDPRKDVWVETGTDQGKVYYYHSITRQSVWKRPAEENAQIITQNEANALAAAATAGVLPGFGMMVPPSECSGQQQRKNMLAAQDQESGNSTGHRAKDKHMESFGESTNMDERSSGDNQTINDTNKAHDTNAEQSGLKEDHPHQNAPIVGPMRPGLGQEMGIGSARSMPLLGPPTGLSMVGPHARLMPPPRMQMPGVQGFSGMPIGGPVPHPIVPTIIPPGSTVWRAHKAPDGRPYYYNVMNMETQWNKPKELEEMEQAAKKAAAEKEAQKLEAERRMVLGQVLTDRLADGAKQARIDPDLDQMGSLAAAMTEEEKAKQKQRPVATEPVPGTPWCVVWTGDGKVFFYNPTTRLSMWDRPEELSGRSDINKILTDPPYKRKMAPEEESEPKSLPAAVQIEEISEDAAEMPAKKKKRKKSIDSTTTDKSVPTAPYVPLDERIKQFKEMLLERQVSAFSTWDKELHKIVFDPRYTMLNSKERRQVFDDYVKSRAEEERKEKKMHLLKVKEDFKKLLEESSITSRTSFSEFASKHGKEPRFKAVERMKEREILFNEYIQESKKKKAEETKNKNIKIRSDYMELLAEKKVERYSRWGRAKEKVMSDPRYYAVESSVQREDLWNEYCEQKRKSDKMDDDDDAESEKKRRTEESMKARLEQVEKEKAERSREIDSERQKHRADEAIQHFKALLADMVRGTNQSWSETRRQLRKEPRWGLASLISKEEKERYFDEHIEELNKKKRSAFRQLLVETPNVDFTSSWKEVKKIIKEDQRYSKFSSSDRKREREFDEVMKDKRSQAKGEFRDLLKETKAITHKTKEMIKNNPQHMKEIISILENDKRYLVLNCMERDREDMIYFHIDELHRKGPPPPPTATEPSRRPAK